MDHVLASRNEYKCSGGFRSKFYANQDLLDLDLLNLSNIEILKCKCETLPKALRTQALTALTSNFGLVQYAW